MFNNQNRQRIFWWQPFFWWLAGANAEILSRPECRTDRMKFTGTGMNVLATSILGGISGGYALMAVFGSLWIAVILGIFWGYITITIDRSFLITSKNSTKFWDKVKMAVPRLMLASMLGLIISKPLELRMFQAEVFAQLAQNQRTQSIDGQAIQRLKDEKTEKEKSVKEVREQWESYNQAAIDEATGEVGTGRPGRGSVYDLKQDTANKIYADLRQQETELTQIKQKIGQHEDRLEKRTQEILNGRASLLEQLGALSDLAKNNATLALAIYTITLLFITLEVMPVLVKLMSQSGPYDILLEAEQEQVKKSSELDGLEAQEAREQEFIIRQKLRGERLKQILTMVRDVLDTQFGEAIQQMLLRPEYAQAFNKVMDILQQSVITTIEHEAYQARLYDIQGVQQTMRQTYTDFKQQRIEQQAQHRWQQAQMDSLKQTVEQLEQKASAAAKTAEHTTIPTSAEVNSAA